MADQFDEEMGSSQPKPSNSKRSDNSPLKILLLVFGTLACITVLVCCGGGIWLYFRAVEVAQTIKDAVKDISISNPDDIRRVTSEIADISIPNEFVPEAGNSIFGTKTVLYNWCPTGTCDSPRNNLGA